MCDAKRAVGEDDLEVDTVAPPWELFPFKFAVRWNQVPPKGNNLLYSKSILKAPKRSPCFAGTLERRNHNIPQRQRKRHDFPFIFFQEGKKEASFLARYEKTKY